MFGKTQCWWVEVGGRIIHVADTSERERSSKCHGGKNKYGPCIWYQLCHVFAVQHWESVPAFSFSYLLCKQLHQMRSVVSQIYILSDKNSGKIFP